MTLEQGQVIKLEGVRNPILVVSKDYYNKLGFIIGCAVVNDAIENAINIRIASEGFEGIVLCDQVRNFDIFTRDYRILGKIDMNSRILISDIIQGLFDYK